MDRAARYFSDGGAHQDTLDRIPDYVLGKIQGEALALLAVNPDNRWLLNQVCVIFGYIEAFTFYPDGEFPWGHVVGRLFRMRIAAARTVVRVDVVALPARRQASHNVITKAMTMERAREIRYEGRWVSRVWLARHIL